MVNSHAFGSSWFIDLITLKIWHISKTWQFTACRGHENIKNCSTASRTKLCKPQILVIAQISQHSFFENNDILWFVNNTVNSGWVSIWKTHIWLRNPCGLGYSYETYSWQWDSNNLLARQSMIVGYISHLDLPPSSWLSCALVRNVHNWHYFCLFIYRSRQGKCYCGERVPVKLYSNVEKESRSWYTVFLKSVWVPLFGPQILFHIILTSLVPVCT